MQQREFKQQQEALHSLEKEAQARSAKLERKQREESELTERLRSYERQAQEAEKELAAQSDIPPASMFNFKTALEAAQERRAAREKSGPPSD